MYGFLAWNLFLACVPFAITNKLMKNQHWIKNGVKSTLAEIHLNKKR
jgi:uncharacterized membrane protein